MISKNNKICVVIIYFVVFVFLFRVEEGNRNIEISLCYATNKEKEFSLFSPFSLLSLTENYAFKIIFEIYLYC